MILSVEAHFPFTSTPSYLRRARPFPLTSLLHSASLSTVHLRYGLSELVASVNG